MLLRRYPVELFLAIAGVIVLTEWLVLQSRAFAQQPNPIALGVTVDVVVGLPLLYYWLVVRTGRWSKTSVVAVFGMALGLAKWLLPTAHQTYVNGLAVALPLHELGVLAYVGWHGAQLLKTYQTYRRTSPDFQRNVQQSLTDITHQPKLSQLLANEATLMRYGLFGWLGNPEISEGQQPIWSHRDTGQVALLVMLAVVACIELVAVHLLVARWSAIGAWGLTVVSVNGLMWLMAEIGTTLKRPSFIEGQTLHVRFGMRWRGTVALTNIERVECLHERPAKNAQMLIGPVLVQPNLLITFREPVVFDGIYGLRKTAKQVAILTDTADCPLPTEDC